MVVGIRSTMQRFAKHSSSRPERTEVGVGSLVTGFVTLMVLGTDLFVVAPLLPLIARDYTISVGTAGIAVTAFSVAYVAAAPWLGARADRLGRRRLLTIGLLCFAAANVLTGLAPTFAVLIIARVLTGAAAAAVTPSVYALTGQYAPSGRRGGWLAIVGAGLLISLATGAPIGSLTAAATNWHIVFVAIAVLAVLLAVVNRVAWPPGAPSGGAATAPPGILTKIRAASVTALWGMSIYVLYTYLAAGLGKTAGLSPGAIAVVLVVYGVGAVLGSLGGGRLADRYGPGK
ncbi:MAG: MFS transporter, partial [Pseudonocardiales bacterium]|nr:MFS transporter [Pseudonocardiales bacterium]